MSKDTMTIQFESIAEMHSLLGIPAPKHPLFSITRFDDFPPVQVDQRTRLINSFYQITLKTDCACKIQYGQTMFDFDEGVISCFAPGQVYFVDKDFVPAKSGWLLSIQPDFLRTYPISKKIKDLGYFNYEVNEALILSEDEQQSVEFIFQQIEKEYYRPIDSFSQDLIIANLDLVLSYCNRYYTRQFNTRKAMNSELVSKVENLLNAGFAKGAERLPTASELASSLGLSAKYLSDCLKQYTGLTTQQLIHEKLIEQAKELLTATELTVAEIAYQLGFDYSQSFSKLFKNKTSYTPLAYRKLYL